MTRCRYCNGEIPKGDAALCFGQLANTDGTHKFCEPVRDARFACDLVGGHELCVTIPGIGSVDDADAPTLWRDMANKLIEIAQSISERADEMERLQEDSDADRVALEIYDAIRLSMDPEYVSDLERQQEKLD